MRNIITAYYTPDSKTPVQINQAGSVRAARRMAVDHMTENHYGAAVCEITHRDTGELYVVFTYSADGQLHLMFSGDQKNPVCLVL